MTEASEIDTMQAMLSGYGANRNLIAKFLSKVQIGKTLPEWDVILDLPVVVDVFLDERFPTVIVSPLFSFLEEEIMKTKLPRIGLE